MTAREGAFLGAFFTFFVLLLLRTAQVDLIELILIWMVQ